MMAAAAGALNSGKWQPVETTPKIWTADLKEHKVAKKIENATLLETFTNNVVADNSVALGAKNKATVRNLWEGAETFVELKDQAEERPQAELATEFSFDSALNGGSALGKTEKPIGAEVKARRMILDQVGSSLTDLALQHKEGAGERVLKIKLKPAELGTVEITLSKNADGVIDAHFKTDNPHTQHMLSETLAQLRDSLENSGMKVGNLETSCSNSFSGGNAAGGERERQTFSTPREQLFEQPQFSASTKSNDESKLDRLLNLRA
ncbi:MAG: flagellar hook-length control protein FliK [Pyrinomonadaceae bacterium]